ncbi:MAG: rod shape-determining protein RodA [Alphaproteobacteria bacterium]|nr:rod shape-determining protein RodA [Alphaproteobacteria bacterium]
MRFRSSFSSRRPELGFLEKVVSINWGLIVLIAMAASIGFATQYSAAGGSLEPWAGRQMVRFAIGLAVLLVVALVPLRWWFKLAYPIYTAAFLLLIAVEIAGRIGMGAQRWLDLGVFQVQPSELMKIGLILVLARYFHGMNQENIGRVTYLIWPIVIALAPAALVVKQPDLGSALILLSVTGGMLFLAGVRLWKFGAVIAAGLAILPVAWGHLRTYQKQRVLTFINPENDPLGSGYHIIQSKIALGSGGIWGKGFLQGTQSHLQFLPEKQTDFIFTTFAEEFGMVGGMVLIALYAAILVYGMMIALLSKSQFGRLMAAGIMVSFWVYAFVNMAMVMGMLPVVGEPLPFVSYGGTSLMTLLISFGLVINAYVHRDSFVGRYGDEGGG